MDMSRIAAYTYRAESLCPSCTAKTLRAEGENWIKDDDNPHAQIGLTGAFAGIDTRDQSSYDSGVFPKAVPASGLEAGEKCARCSIQLR